MDIDELIFSTDEEQQERYCRYMENSTPYNANLISVAQKIINNKSYPQLCEILRNYDHLVREKYDYTENLELPYWTVGFSQKC